MVKTQKKYSVISDESRVRFLTSVLRAKRPIRKAAEDSGLKLSTAKAILKTYKNEGRIGKKKTRASRSWTPEDFRSREGDSVEGKDRLKANNGGNNECKPVLPNKLQVLGLKIEEDKTRIPQVSEDSLQEKQRDNGYCRIKIEEESMKIKIEAESMRIPEIKVNKGPALEVVGQLKVPQAFSSKRLSKSPSAPAQDPMNYTFRQAETLEKHSTSGGFKIPQGNYGKNVSNPQPEGFEVYSKTRRMTKNEMLDELGLGSYEHQEEGKREAPLELQDEAFVDLRMMETVKNRRDAADLIIGSIERNIQKIQLQREKLKQRENSLKSREKSQISPHRDENLTNIVLYDQFERSQIVSHNISTIETPTVQNLEALVVAHKERMQGLQHRYLENKIHRIDRSGSGLSRPQQPEENQDPNMMTLKIKHVPFKGGKGLGRREKVENDRSFMPERKTTPKNFERDFRDYLKNKSEKKIEPKGRSRSRGRPESSSSSAQKHWKVDLGTIPREEMELMQFFFEDIPQVGPDVIAKDDLVDYLKKNEKIMDLYELDPEDLERELGQLTTNAKLTINFQEFVNFLKMPRTRTQNLVTQEDYAPSPKNHSFKGNISFLTEKDFLQMEKIYNELDRHQDFIVPLSDLVHSLRNDVQIGRLLPEPMVYLVKIGKFLSLDRALYQLEREGGSSEERKEKEYISWNYFKDFLLNYRLRPYLTRDRDAAPSEEDALTIDHRLLESLKSCYDKVPKFEGGFCRLKDLLAEVRSIKRYEFLADSVVRTKVPASSIRSESLRDIVKRIEVEADEFLDYDEFLEFFTCRGRPKSHIIVDSVERNQNLQRKLRAFLDNKGALPKKNSPLKRPGSPGKKDLEKHEEQWKRGLNSEDSPKKRAASNERADAMKIRVTSQSSERRSPDGLSTKRPWNLNPTFERSVSWQDVVLTKPNLPSFPSPHRQKSPHSQPSARNGEIRVIEGYDSDPEYKQEPARTIKNLNLSFTATRKRDQNALKITVPVPFRFDERDRLSKAQQNFAGRTESKERKRGFRANPVPEYVKQTNLLEKILKEQEARREEVRKNSRILTMQREKPFSFNLRAGEGQRIRKKNRFERKEFRFKANPVPWFCSVRLLEIMNQEERAKREERVSKNAQISLNLSKLPPRMQKHEQERRANELKYGPQYQKNYYDEDCTFKPRSPKKVPDFKRLHRTFQSLLDNKRRNYRPTRAFSPKFHESKKTRKIDNFEEEEAQRQLLLRAEKERKEQMRKMDKKPAYQPPSTKKWEAALEKAKREREEKEEKQREKQREEKERVDKHNKAKTRVQASNAIVDSRKILKEKQELKGLEFKEKMENDKNRYKLWKKEMNEKVSQRALLVETATKRDKAFEKMKKLARLHKIMVETGNKRMDIFTEEERDLLGDLEFLKRHKMLNVLDFE